MSINSIYGLNTLRMGGLASGLDTESIVRDLMKIELMKVDKLKQEKQILEWRKDDYRSTTNLLRGFYDDYFDILYSKTNMASPNTYNTLKINSSMEDYLKVSANSDAFISDKTISKISLATAAKADSHSVSTPLVGQEITEESNLSGHHSILVTLDGTTKAIEFDFNLGGGSLDYEDLANTFQGELDQAFGGGRIKVSFEDNSFKLSTDDNTSTITVMEHTLEGVDSLGFSLNQSNRIDLNSTLLGIRGLDDSTGSTQTRLEFDGDGMVSFTINGEEFSFSENDTLRSVISRINSSKAGVTLNYNSISDEFTLTNKATGYAETLTFSDNSGNFFEALGFEGNGENNTYHGQDAMMVINNSTIYRGSNTFTIDGVTYNLVKDFEATDEIDEISVKMSTDVDKAFDNIKGFVDSYNNILDSLNATLGEKRYRDYPPLTDEQRDNMSDKEVELWEERAKSGLLKDDSILQSIVNNMRRAIVDSVKETGISLSSIGITTGSYTEGGRLKIDEQKLKGALAEKGEEITHFFTRKSDIDYSPDNDATQRQTRYQESGLIQRLSDILQDNIRTRRDSNDRKGLLLEKAGIVGDVTERNNFVDNQLRDMNKRIDEALQRMYASESRYWAQFTAMESALARMNSQSAWLAQQFGGGMY